ncbi:MAG: PilZ domain-containing protein [Terriglobales bacterium]
MGHLHRRASIRIEDRTSARLEVQLVGETLAATELAVVQNMSPHGALVRTRSLHLPGERLALRSPSGRPLARARVIYVLASGGQYLVGMELLLPASEWTATPPGPGRRTPG